MSDLAQMTRPQLERELARSFAVQLRLRARLTTLESEAAELREQRSTLTSYHADEMASVRTELRLAERRAALVRERLR